MRRKLFSFIRRRARDIAADVDEELQFHLERRADELIATGVAPEAARTRARREFGDVDDTREYLRSLDHRIERERRQKDYCAELRQDLAFALRKLRSTPGFAILAILTLALGIGANTAIFSIVNGVLLRPLDFPRPEQLLRLSWSDGRAAEVRGLVSAVDIEDWRERDSDLAAVSGYWYGDGTTGVDLTGAGEAQRLAAAFVERDFFTTLGVNAAAGRLPRPDELTRGGNVRVVVLSHGCWQSRFGGSPSVIDSTLTLGGELYTVIGVLPPAFRYPAPGIDVYLPFATITDNMAPRIRVDRFLDGIARLRPGVTVPQAQSRGAVVAAALASEFADDSSYDGMTVEPMQAAMTGAVRTSLLVLLGTVGLVLLLACVNLASLQLARGAARAQEVAVRLSLGATRVRIARQMLTESLLLGLVGGAAGLGVGVLGMRALLALNAGQIPRAAEVAVDSRVLLFTLGLSLLTGILFGVVPAFRSAGGNLQETLRQGGRGVVGGHRLRSALVVLQVALAIVLAAGASLMTQSFVQLLNVDPGFRPDHLVAVNFTINDTHWPTMAGALGFYRGVIDRARALPGVTSAGAAQYAPFQALGERASFLPQGVNEPSSTQWPIGYIQRVSDGYFETIGTPIISGREFSLQDGPASPPGLVVNRALAERYFAGGDAVGKTLSFGTVGIPIIGVVGDIRQHAIDEPAPSLIYVNNLRSLRVKTTLVLRTRGDPLAVVRGVRAAIQAMDPDQPITSVFTFDDLLNDALARPRALTTLLGAFGVIGLILGALGIYGVLAYLVTQRRREIGVRIALGAGRGRVLGMVVGRGIGLAIAGTAVGLPAALAFAHVMRGVLYGVSPGNPLSFALVIAVLIVAALAASYLPARRAARVDPAISLRVE